METKSGWRAVPAPLLVSLAVWCAYMAVRVVILHSVSFERGFSAKLQLTGEGLGFACTILALVGTVELMNRATGAVRTMLKLAAIGVALALAVDVLAGFIQFSKEPWKHEWVYKAYSYGSFAAWGAFAVGLTLAASPAKRAFGFAAIAITVLVALPMPLDEKLWHAIGLEGKTLHTVHLLLRCVQLALLALAAVAAASSSSGETTPQPATAAEGLRSAATGLWIRVIAVVVVALFMMMVMTSRGAGKGTLSFLKLLMIGQPIFNIIALTITGLGALRAARSGLSDLQPYVLAIGGGASLWGAGVYLAQTPWTYRALYGRDSDYGGFGGGSSFEQEWMTALAVALPLVIAIGTGMLATALSGFAARRGDEDLRTEAQGKGIGYVVLMVVAVAVSAWMLPKAQSAGSAAMLLILAAIASLWATIMMAKLLRRGADAVEHHMPGLPPASVVGTPPSV